MSDVARAGRLVALVAMASLAAACASSHATVVTTAPAPPSAHRAEAPTAPAATTPPRPSDRDHTINLDGLPPAFAQLTPRDRERWHACHIFFLGDEHTGAPSERYSPTPGQRFQPPAEQHLAFSVTPTEYVATPDAARRAFLVRHGCPDSIVDLADGTHLDLIEH